MIEVLKFKAEHLVELMEQEATAYLRPYMTSEHMKALEESEHSYTLKINNRTVFCGGVVDIWQGRGEAWAIIDCVCKKEFLAIHRVVKRFLEGCTIRRVEATVDLNFPQGHKWMRMLGFVLEAARMKNYRQDGRDASLYARVF